MNPVARTDELLREELGDELVLYDRRTHETHALNGIAACLYRHSDGVHSIEDLVPVLRLAGHPEADTKVVESVLADLQTASLIEWEPRDAAESEFYSRRGMLRKVGVAAAVGALAIPAVQSVVAPHYAAAAVSFAPIRQP